jgi:cobalt-zinc-cadmium resistance protein CzcA
MIERMIEWALGSRLLVLLAALAVAIAGAISLSRLPVDAVPDITNVSVMVNTKTGALAPEEIEKTVTFPIESELAGLPDVEDIRSLSKYGLSQVIIVFKDRTDIYFARQQVSERLQSISGMLPEGISPELGPVSTGLGEVYMYSVAAKKGSALATGPEMEKLLYLRTIQDLRIKPVLKAVAGVAEVESNGGYKKQIHINVDPGRMEAYGINCHELVKSVENLGENYGGGYIQSKGTQIIVRTYGRIDSIGQIGNIPVRLNVFGQPVRLREVATIKEGHQQRLGAATHNGEEAVLGTVLMRIGANSREVSLRVHEEIGKIPLPADVEIRTLYTRSFLVNATIRTVAKNLAEGGILVIAVLFLLLGNIRAALIVALAIPLSMLFAISGMLAAGISASLMSLGAIDFGLIVDGSVVMIENMIRRLEQDGRSFSSLTSSDRARLIGESAREVGKPVVLGLLIIMAVYLPVLTLSGIEGKMFKPMAETVLYALGASLLIAVFLMPVLALYFLRHRHGEKESRLFKWINRGYRPFLAYSLDHRWAVILPTLFIALLSIALFTRLGSDFIPRLDEGDMVIGLVRDTSISIDKSVEEQLKSDRVIARFGEVESVFSRMGTPESATDPMGVNFADTFVILKKNRSEWPARADGKRLTKTDLFEQIGQAIDREVPGQEVSLTQPIEMRFNEILEGSRADITLRIFGPGLDTLFTLVNQAQPLVEGIPGAASVEMDPLTALRKSPVLDVRLDYDRISRYGINISDVNSAFEIAMNGREVGYLFEEEMRYPIVVRLSDQFRRNTGDIGRIPVAFPEGGSIPISRLSDIKYRDQITTIARSRARRYAAVSINLKNRDTQSFVDEAREKIRAGLEIPAGYSLDWGGQFKNLETARNRLLVIIPVVLAVIFIILLRTFGSIRQAFLVFNSIPFAVTGGIILLFIRGIPMSVSAGVGFIALTGIAILNGMVLVSFFNQLRERGHTVRQAVCEGTLTRLRPVLMTALVASLGFIPMAYNTGMGAEVQRPLATVVIGGLLSATILTLILLPTLYLWLESGHETTTDTMSTVLHPASPKSRKGAKTGTPFR